MLNQDVGWVSFLNPNDWSASLEEGHGRNARVPTTSMMTVGTRALRPCPHKTNI